MHNLSAKLSLVTSHSENSNESFSHEVSFFILIAIETKTAVPPTLRPANLSWSKKVYPSG